MCYPAILESSRCLSNITSPLTCTPCELDMWQIFGKWTGHWVFSSSLSKYCLCASPHPWWTQSSLFPSTLVLSWKFKAWDRFLCRSEVRWILWDRRNFVGACFEIPVDSVQQDLRIQGTPWKYGISRQAGGRELSTLLFPEGNKWTLISFSKFYFFLSHLVFQEAVSRMWIAQCSSSFLCGKGIHSPSLHAKSTHSSKLSLELLKLLNSHTAPAA